MSRYIVIRSDTKSISSPMSKKDAIKSIKSYNREGICSYLVNTHRDLDIHNADNINIYK